MQTSEKTQPFTAKTMLLVMDGMHARFFMAMGHNVQQVAEMKADGYPLNDMEKGVSVNAGTHTVATIEDEQLKNRVRKVFFKDVAKHLLQEHQHDTYDHLIIALPKQYTNEFPDELHNYVKEKLQIVIPKILIHHETNDIIKHIQDSLWTNTKT